MVARKLAPCGTLTAYNRHKRRGEDADEACLAAKAEDKARRDAERRAAAAEGAAEVRGSMPSESDRLALLREQRDVLRAHTLSAPPQSVAAISKQLVAVLAEIDEMETAARKGAASDGGASGGGGVIDDIARRRAEREARRRAASQG